MRVGRRKMNGSVVPNTKQYAQYWFYSTVVLVFLQKLWKPSFCLKVITVIITINMPFVTKTSLRNIIFLINCGIQNERTLLLHCPFNYYFCGDREKYQITPLAQGGAEDSIRRLLVKTPPIPLVAPDVRCAISRFPRPWQVLFKSLGYMLEECWNKITVLIRYYLLCNLHRYSAKNLRVKCFI